MVKILASVTYSVNGRIYFFGYCGKIYVTKIYQFIILSVKFSCTKYIHIVVHWIYQGLSALRLCARFVTPVILILFVALKASGEVQQALIWELCNKKVF